MPTAESFANIQIPSRLFSGRWEATNDDIDLSDRILMEPRKDLTAVYNRISRKLR
jgi:hypothetical protein